MASKRRNTPSSQKCMKIRRKRLVIRDDGLRQDTVEFKVVKRRFIPVSGRSLANYSIYSMKRVRSHISPYVHQTICIGDEDDYGISGIRSYENESTDMTDTRISYLRMFFLFLMVDLHQIVSLEPSSPYLALCLW